MPNLKFRSDLITGLLNNEKDHIGHLMRSLDVTTPITLCQGYGVGHSVPLRLLAYAVPVLRLARQLPRETQVEFYWATQGVLRANPDYDSAQITKSSEVARNLLTSYVNTFHPGLREQVRIMNDLNPPPKAREAVSWLLEEANAVVLEIPSIASFVASRGGITALRYMVEHALYMRDPLTFEGEPLPDLVASRTYPNMKFIPEGNLPKGGHLVMIGGPSERVFWKLRQGLLKRLPIHEMWKSHQLFTGVGKVPPYHPQSDEPYKDVDGTVCSLPTPNLRDLLSLKNGWFLKDWLVLLQDAAGVERFTVNLKRDGSLTQEEKDALQEGLGRLFGWFRSQLRPPQRVGAPVMQ